jgi:non-ribosomal peptide synthetase component F
MKEEVYKQTIFSKEKYKEQLEYWRKIITHELEPVDIPLDFHRAHQRERAIDSIKIKLPGELAIKVFNLSKKSDLTLYVVLLAAFKAFLYRCARGEKTLLASPLLKLENKTTKQHQYNHSILLTDRVNTGLTYKELLLETKNKTLEAYKNQNYPLDLAFKKNGLQIDRYPFLHRIVFLLNNLHDEKDVTGLNYDLLFSFLREGKNIAVTITYNRGIFKKETVEKLAGRYVKILGSCVNNIDTRIKDLDIFGEEERRQLLFEFNNTQSEYPKTKTIHQLFVRQVEQTPHQIALAGHHAANQKHKKNHNMSDLSYMSYKELNKTSNQLAKLLIKKGVRADRLVGLMMEPCLEMIIGVLGILKAGVLTCPSMRQSRENAYIPCCKTAVLLYC